MRNLLIAWSLAAAIGPAQSLMAGPFGCESVAGSVVFKDTLYGVLTGSLLTGLYILSQPQDSRKNVEQSLSGGAAFGGLAGFGLGVTEIFLRECPPGRVGQGAAWNGSFAAVPLPSGGLATGLRLTWNFD